MIEPKLGWQTGTIKISSVDFFEQIEKKDKEIKRMREIINDAHTRLSNMHGHEWEEVTSELMDLLEVDK